MDGVNVKLIGYSPMGMTYRRRPIVWNMKTKKDMILEFLKWFGIGIIGFILGLIVYGALSGVWRGAFY